MRRILLKVVAALATAVTTLADVTLFTDRAQFEASGSIIENTNFDDMPQDIITLDPLFSRGSVTYTAPQGIIVGTGQGFNNPRALIANNMWTPLTALVDTAAFQYNMLGFDAALLGAEAFGVDLSVTTSRGVYTVPISLNVGQPLSFYGVRANYQGETITAFSLNVKTPTWGSAPAITAVTLGLAPVPEPQMLAALSAAVLVTIGISRRFSR